MKFFRFVFLLFVLFIFSACEDLSFNDADIFSPKATPVQEIPTPKAENKETPNTDENSEQISEEETTIVSEDLELSENLVIQNRKVILDMVTIQTLQHDLTIIAEEFVSNHSFVRNFPEGQKADKNEDGKSGGHVLVKAKTAKGSLGLILSGENGGYVSTRRISKRERNKLMGRNGENGYDAIYDTWCKDIYIPILVGKIVIDRNCRKECRVEPTRGRNGEDGRQGYPGYTGKRGGNSGSFYLQSFNLSDFHLTDVQKTIGLGSRGGRGSSGGYGGARGRNGRDRRGLCSVNLPRPKSGRKGRRGERGRKGEKGKEGAVCLENLNNQQTQAKVNIEANQKPLEAQSKDKKTDIKCNERESGIACRKMLAEKNSDETLKKEGVVCY